MVIGAGDEINIICRASDAFDIARVYLEGLRQEKREAENGEGEAGEHSAFAGIAIFHSHAPYADAYRIAEECCESGKDYMKKKGVRDAALIDFQYCQGAIDKDLESIRRDETEHMISRPWLIFGTVQNRDKDKADIETIGRMWPFLKELGRSNVKGLAEKALLGETEFFMELSRIKAHMSEEKLKGCIKVSMTTGEDTTYSLREAFQYVEGLDPQLCRKLTYDMVIMYDLWFKGDEKVAKEETD